MADDFEEWKKKVLAPIFFEAGAALFDCQSFEYEIAFLLFMCARLGLSGLDPARCASILDDEEKKTAGQLIQMLKMHLRIDDEIENGLAKALETRNHLIHRYLIENSERMMDVQEHEVLVKEISALRSTVRRSHEQLHPLLRALAESIDGVSLDTMASEAMEKFLRDTREH